MTATKRKADAAAHLEEWDISSEDNRGFHEAADIFPSMSIEEFEAFKKDIAENGLQTPIVTLPDGNIIDGRHRWRACMELKVKPRYTVHNGNPWTYVISANLHRRHLTTSQKSIVGGRIAVRTLGQHGSPEARKRSSDPSQKDERPPTIPETAGLLGISDKTIKRGRELLSRGNPDLVELVEEGKTRVETAARIARMDQDTQDEFVARVRAGEKPRDIAPVGKGYTGGNGERVIKHPSVAVFTRLNAERLSSGLIGIEMAFRDVTKIDPAVPSGTAKSLIKQIGSCKTVLNRLTRLLQYAAEEE